MKKIWKNLCVSAMALTTMMGVAGCGKDAKWTSIDLDGDGKISAWETIFEGEDDSRRVIGNNSTQPLEIESISNLAELRAINDKLEDRVIYKLTNDIDCNGEEVCINLHGCILLGNNKNIYNFKMTQVTYPEDSEEAKSADVKYALFHNGISIYDLHVFMGKQTINHTTLAKNNYISPLFDIYNIENVKVRGKVTLERSKQDNMAQDKVNNVVNMSMLALYSEKADRDTFNISDIEVAGEIDYKEAIDSSAETSYQTTLNIGGITKSVVKNTHVLTNTVVGENEVVSVVDTDFTEKIKSTIRNVNMNLNVNIANALNTKIGLIACENEGFITNCNTTGSINETFADNKTSIVLSGVVAENKSLGEIRYCSTDAEINVTNPNNSAAKAGATCFVAGVVGINNSGVLDYVTSDAKIHLQNLYNTGTGNSQRWSVCTGSIMGKSEYGYLTRALAKGSIVCENIDKLEIANVAGRAEYGMIESVVCTTNINVNVVEVSSAVVNFGMVAIFEEVGNIAGEQYYIDNFIKSPIFARIMVAGINEVHMKNMSATNFRYRLGLRNPYSHYVGDRDVVEQDENGDDIITQKPIYETQLPSSFKNIFFSNEEYEFLPFTTERDGEEKRYTIESDTAMYANSNNKPSGSSREMYKQPRFGFNNMGFKNAFNNAEINWDGQTALSDLKFTLSDQVTDTSIFHDVHFNGELVNFDYDMDGECRYLRTEDEMLSLIYYNIINESKVDSRAIVISDNFINSDYEYLYYEDGEQVGIMPNIDAPNDRGAVNFKFAKNIEYLLKECLGVNDENMVSYLNRDLKSVYEPEVEDVVIKYIRFTFTDRDYTYKLTFNVLPWQESLDAVEAGAEYIVYMDFVKTSN